MALVEISGIYVSQRSHDNCVHCDAIIINKMDSGDAISSEPTSAGIRSSTRVRKRPTYFMPGSSYENNAEEDVKFKVVVTGSKGFKDFQDTVDFKGTSNWKLSQILRKVARGLRVESRSRYIWTIWSEEKKSKC